MTTRPARSLTLRAALSASLATAALVVLPAAPVHAATVSVGARPPLVHVHFDKAETRRIAAAANTGFTPFLATLCGMIPGGKKTLAPKAGCAVGSSVDVVRVAVLLRHGPGAEA